MGKVLPGRCDASRSSEFPPASRKRRSSNLRQGEGVFPTFVIRRREDVGLVRRLTVEKGARRWPGRRVKSSKPRRDGWSRDGEGVEIVSCGLVLASIETAGPRGQSTRHRRGVGSCSSSVKVDVVRSIPVVVVVVVGRTVGGPPGCGLPGRLWRC